MLLRKRGLFFYFAKLYNQTMKLEPLFTSKENQLYDLSGKLVPTDGCVVLKAESLNESYSVPSGNGRPYLIQISWKQIGLDETSYNEELLASLRDFLKVLESKNLFTLMEAASGEKELSAQQKSDFTASCKHCARRIKDCRSVIGFALPQEVDPDEFAEELSQKHAHYIYFTKNPSLLKDGSIVKYS